MAFLDFTDEVTFYQIRNANVVHIITGLGDGGAERNLFRLVKETQYLSHFVICMGPTGKYSEQLNKLGCPAFHLGLKKNMSSVVKALGFALLVRFKDEQVIQSWMYHADLLGCLLKLRHWHVKLFWGVRHGDLIPKHSKASTRFLRVVLSLLSRFVPHNIIYCSYSSRLIHEKNGYDASKGFVIENGLSSEEIVPRSDTEIKSSRKNDNRIFTVGHIGRFHPMKRHFWILEAIFEGLERRNLNYAVVLAGEGVTDANIELTDFVKEKFGGLERFSLLGSVNEINRVYRQCDLMLWGSGPGEGFPNVILEAMGARTLCCVTNVAAAPTIVGNSGWISEHDDLNGFAKNLYDAYQRSKDQLSWNALRMQAQDRVINKFTLRKMAKRYEKLWALN